MSDDQNLNFSSDLEVDNYLTQIKALLSCRRKCMYQIDLKPVFVSGLILGQQGNLNKNLF